ncbi:MAG TPA: hypothetical protein VMQ86_16285 [Bryobacteraceae bacterium]|jgi:hypothetical protein|nr:hypothetical protein [Bryobacteraceae bacterium]
MVVLCLPALPIEAAGQSVFQEVKPPVAGGMEALSASSPSDIWAVGIDDQFLMHFDGTK